MSLQHRVSLSSVLVVSTSPDLLGSRPLASLASSNEGCRWPTPTTCDASRCHWPTSGDPQRRLRLSRRWQGLRLVVSRACPGPAAHIRTDIAVLYVGDEAEKQALLLGNPTSSSPRRLRRLPLGHGPPEAGRRPPAARAGHRRVAPTSRGRDRAVAMTVSNEHTFGSNGRCRPSPETSRHREGRKDSEQIIGALLLHGCPEREQLFVLVAQRSRRSVTRNEALFLGSVRFFASVNWRMRSSRTSRSA